MPNGDSSLSSLDWIEIKAFFERLSPVLLDFARAHNLAMDKYYHESPCWLFRFRHPKGGGGSIGLHRVDDLTVRINTSWYIDEYDSFTRYLKSGTGRQLLLGNINLNEALEEDLKEIISWNRIEMTPHPDYKNVWSIYTKQKWEEIFDPKQLPLVKL